MRESREDRGRLWRERKIDAFQTIAICHRRYLITAVDYRSNMITAERHLADGSIKVVHIHFADISPSCLLNMDEIKEERRMP